MTGFLKDRQSHWSTACPPVASVWIAIMLSRPKSISTNLSARTKMMIPCQSAHLHSGRAFSSVLSLIDLIARWPHKYYPHLMYGVIFIMIFGTRASSVWVWVQLSACFQTFIKPAPINLRWWKTLSGKKKINSTSTNGITCVQMYVCCDHGRSPFYLHAYIIASARQYTQTHS